MCSIGQGSHLQRAPSASELAGQGISLCDSLGPVQGVWWEASGGRARSCKSSESAFVDALSDAGRKLSQGVLGSLLG